MTKFKLALALLAVAGISGFAVYAYMSVALIQQALDAKNAQVSDLQDQVNDLKELPAVLKK